MAAQYKRVNILDRDIQLHCNECAESRGIQNPGHSHDALLGKFAYTESRLNHRIEGITHNDNDAVRRVLHDLFSDALDDAVIRLQKIVAAHAWLTWDSCRDHDDVRVGGFFISVRSREPAV